MNSNLHSIRESDTKLPEVLSPKETILAFRKGVNVTQSMDVTNYNVGDMRPEFFATQNIQMPGRVENTFSPMENADSNDHVMIKQTQSNDKNSRIHGKERGYLEMVEGINQKVKAERTRREQAMSLTRGGTTENEANTIQEKSQSERESLITKYMGSKKLQAHESQMKISEKHEELSFQNENRILPGTQLNFAPRSNKIVFKPQNVPDNQTQKGVEITGQISPPGQERGGQKYNLNPRIIDKREILRVSNNMKDPKSKQRKANNIEIENPMVRQSFESMNSSYSVMKESYMHRITSQECDDSGHEIDLNIRNNLFKTVPKILSFDNREIEEGGKSDAFQEFYPQKFDFDNFVFYNDKLQNFKVKQNTMNMVYAKNNPQNKQKIFAQLQKMILDQVGNMIEEEFASVPEIIKKPNIKAYNRLFLENPKLQKMLTEFNEHLTKIMDDEFKKNKTQMQLFMHHPRSLSDRPPIINHYSKYDIQKNKREKATVNQSLDYAKEKYNYARERIERKNREQKGQKRVNTRQKIRDCQQAERAEEQRVEKQGQKSQMTSALTSGIVSPKTPRATSKMGKDKFNGNYKVFSDFQLKILNQTQAIDSLINEMDEETQDFQSQLNKLDTEVFDLQEISRINNFPKHPGMKISSLLKNMAKQPTYTMMDIMKYQKDMWLTLGEFEQKLVEEIKGHELEMYRKDNIHRIHMERVQQQAAFRIESLEQALLELKLSKMKEIDQLNMTNAELESKFLQIKTNGSKYDTVTTEIKNTQITSVPVAKVMINKLTNFLQTSFTQQAIMNKVAEISSNQVNIAEEQVKKIKKDVVYQSTQRLYYQHIIVKFLRDTGFQNDNISNLETFEKFNENSENRDDQKENRRIFEMFEVSQFMVDLANKIRGMEHWMTKAADKMTKTDWDGSNAKDSSGTKKQVQSLNWNRRQIVWMFDLNEFIQSSMEGVNDDKPQATMETGNPITAEESAAKIKKLRKAVKGDKQSPLKLRQQSSLKIMFSKTNNNQQSKDGLPGIIPQPKNIEQPLHLNPIEIMDSFSNISSQRSFDSDEKIPPSTKKKERRQTFKIIIPDGDESESKSNKISRKQSLKKSTSLKKQSNRNSSMRKSIKVEVLKKKVNHGESSESMIVMDSKIDLGDFKKQQQDLRGKLMPELRKEFDDLIDSMKRKGKKAPSEHNSGGDLSEKQDQMPTPGRGSPLAKNKLSLGKKNNSENVKNKRGKSMELEPKSVDLPKKEKNMVKEQKLKSAEKSIKEGSRAKSVQAKKEPNKVQKKEVKEKQKKGPMKKLLTSPEPKASARNMPKLSTMSLGAFVPPPLQGICLIDKEIEDLFAQKYQDLVNDSKKVYKKTPQTFKMKAYQIQELQDVVVKTISRSMNNDEKMELFQAELHNFFDKFNALITKEFGFDKTLKFIDQGGEHIPTTPSNKSPKARLGSNKEFGKMAIKLKANKQENLNLPTLEEEELKIDDLLKAVINQEGKIQGFKIREDLIQPLFLQEDSKIKPFKKVIQTCLYLNRIISKGHDHEFQVYEKFDNTNVKETEREFKEIEIQVNVEELEENGIPTKESSSEEEVVETDDINSQVLKMLKNHAIDILVRMQPSRKSYYKVVWDEIDFEKLMSYQMSNVFKDQKEKDLDTLGKGLSVKQYFEVVFFQIGKKLQETYLFPEQKEKLLVDDLIVRNMLDEVDEVKKIDNWTFMEPIVLDDESGKDTLEIETSKSDRKIIYSVGIQAKPEVTLKEVQTGPELMPKAKIIEVEAPPTIIIHKERLTDKQKHLQTKSKNQIVLDKAMEDEFKKTLDIFDVFVESIGKINPDKLKLKAFEGTAIDPSESVNSSKRRNLSVRMQVPPGHDEAKKSFDSNESGEQEMKDKVDEGLGNIRNKLGIVVKNIQQDVTRQKKNINISDHQAYDKIQRITKIINRKDNRYDQDSKSLSEEETSNSAIKTHTQPLNTEFNSYSNLVFQEQSMNRAQQMRTDASPQKMIETNQELIPFMNQNKRYEQSHSNLDNEMLQAFPKILNHIKTDQMGLYMQKGFPRKNVMQIGQNNGKILLQHNKSGLTGMFLSETSQESARNQQLTSPIQQQSADGSMVLGSQQNFMFQGVKGGQVKQQNKNFINKKTESIVFNNIPGFTMKKIQQKQSSRQVGKLAEVSHSVLITGTSHLEDPSTQNVSGEILAGYSTDDPIKNRKFMLPDEVTKRAIANRGSNFKWHTNDLKKKFNYLSQSPQHSIITQDFKRATIKKEREQERVIDDREIHVNVAEDMVKINQLKTIQNHKIYNNNNLRDAERKRLIVPDESGRVLSPSSYAALQAPIKKDGMTVVSNMSRHQQLYKEAFEGHQ